MDELALWMELSHGNWQPVGPKGATFGVAQSEGYDIEVTQVSQPFMDHLREVLSRQTWWSGYKLTMIERLHSDREVDEAVLRIREASSSQVGTASWSADYQDKRYVTSEDAVRLESKLQHKVRQKAENFRLAVAVCLNDIFDVYTGYDHFLAALETVPIPHELIGWYGFSVDPPTSSSYWAMVLS